MHFLVGFFEFNVPEIVESRVRITKFLKSIGISLKLIQSVNVENTVCGGGSWDRYICLHRQIIVLGMSPKRCCSIKTVIQTQEKLVIGRWYRKYKPSRIKKMFRKRSRKSPEAPENFACCKDTIKEREETGRLALKRSKKVSIGCLPMLFMSRHQ